MDVVIPAGLSRLKGTLSLPRDSPGIVVFAHGSGSGRLSPRNRYVARVLQEANLATLLMDLLEEEEDQDRRKVFDIELLAGRLRAGVEYLGDRPETRDLLLGYFGASTGAAAALQAASGQGERVAAIVSRGGRPDLVMNSLPLVKAPTLLVVGGEDKAVIPLNQKAYESLASPKKLVIVPGATHLFEEPGALEKVAQLAADWFHQYMASQP
jgi:putative phosphoribosyl transferase